MKRIRNTVAVMMVLGMSMAAWAQDNQVRTINIDFRDENQNTTVNMSLPLSVIESFRPNIEQALDSIRDGEHNIDFQAIWQSVKDSGPMDFVEVKSEDADVKVSTTDTQLIVRIQEKGEGQNIDVTVPLAVCDALFDHDQLDLDAVIAALEAMAGQDLVRITGNQINGRVWIE